jgi:hypothetical protein
MRYYLDCEFNGMGGELLSLALVREDEISLYAVLPLPKDIDPWVSEHVIPLMHETPEIEWERHPNKRGGHIVVNDALTLGQQISLFLAGDPQPVIVTDWIADAKYFCEVMNAGSLWWTKEGGPMRLLPSFSIEFAKVDAYPTDLPGAIQHNAYWDAMALRHKLQVTSQ